MSHLSGDGIKDKRPPMSFFAAMFVAAFGLNWLWEMLQMPAYAGMSGRPWREKVLVCTLASIGDSIITLGVYGVGALATRRLRWGMQGGWKVYVTVGLLAAACAVVVELTARATGHWSYLERMPTVPMLGVGLWPFLQLTLLVPLALRFAVWWANRDGALKT